MSRAEQLALQLMREAGGDPGMMSFEAPGYSWEHMYSKAKRAGASDKEARAVATQGLRNVTRDPVPGNPNMRDAAAQITINVRRVTANIAQALPYVIFGAGMASNGYRRLIGGLLTGGTVLTSVEVGESDGEPEALVLTYTNGVDVDRVEVTCNAAPYPEVLESTITDQLYLDRVRLRISNPTLQAQFDSDIFVPVRNMWGTQNSRTFSPGAFISPEQFREGIVDVNLGINIDKETAIQSLIIAQPNFTYSHVLTARSFHAVRA